ncbi:hypothetical protein TNCV_2134301 [Trichonephila clavipes]|nr:hypothetical protein TNCV_2134301 [Trichonephila clavipes]
MQHSPSHCVFGAPRTRFGAVKPPFLRSSILALVTSLQFRSRSAALFLLSPPAREMISDIGLYFQPFLRPSGYKRFISLAPTSSNFRLGKGSMLKGIKRLHPQTNDRQRSSLVSDEILRSSYLSRKEGICDKVAFDGSEI